MTYCIQLTCSFGAAPSKVLVVWVAARSKAQVSFNHDQDAELPLAHHSHLLRSCSRTLLWSHDS